MSAQRVKTGFHRIGVILAVICGVAASAMLYGRGYSASQEAIAAVAIGVGLYALAFVLGRVAARLAGDADKISN